MSNQLKFSKIICTKDQYTSYLKNEENKNFLKNHYGDSFILSYITDDVNNSYSLLYCDELGNVHNLTNNTLNAVPNAGQQSGSTINAGDHELGEVTETNGPQVVDPNQGNYTPNP